MKLVLYREKEKQKRKTIHQTIECSQGTALKVDQLSRLLNVDTYELVDLLICFAMANTEISCDEYDDDEQ